MRSSAWSRMQSAVALAAGLSSIVGAGYSAVGRLRGEPSGDVVAVVRDAGTAQPVSGSAIEILTPESVLVATMPPGDDGVAHRALSPGTYRLRVSHPDFVEADRDVRVVPGETTEVQIALAHRPRQAVAARPAAARGGVANVVDRGVSAGRRLLGRIGF